MQMAPLSACVVTVILGMGFFVLMLMNVKALGINVMSVQAVQMPLALILAYAKKVLLAMAYPAKTLMNVNRVSTYAVCMHTAEIVLDFTIALV